MPTTYATKDTDLSPTTDKLAATADNAVSSTRDAANRALDQVAGTIESLRQRVPASLGSVAAKVEDLKQTSLEKARLAKEQVSERLHDASDRTVGYIKDEPYKAMLIAAGTGAVVALLLNYLSRSRSDR